MKRLTILCWLFGLLLTTACNAEVTKENFHWKKFNNSQELAAYLGDAFPIGTPREEVERVLFNGGYKIHQENSFDMKDFDKEHRGSTLDQIAEFYPDFKADKKVTYSITEGYKFRLFSWNIGGYDPNPRAYFNSENQLEAMFLSGDKVHFNNQLN